MTPLPAAEGSTLPGFATAIRRLIDGGSLREPGVDGRQPFSFAVFVIRL
jgi:hypothetical protein